MTIKLEDWIKEVQPKDIPAAYQDYIDAIGTEALLRLASFIGGITTYIPKIDCLIQATRDRLIIQEHTDGAQIKDLAIKYDLTDVWVRKVISQYTMERDQLSLFEASGQ